MPEAKAVRSMFARIAGRYDLLNRVLSAGIDQRWRRLVVSTAGDVRGELVVDACCGTGDLSLAFAERGARVLGVDFTPEMLAHANKKGGAEGIVFAHGDALHLPVESRSAQVATVAFGIRNVEDRVAGLEELARVVRPGGRVLVLEFSMPPGRLLGWIYRTYFTRVLPFIGRRISGDAEAYRYLPDTVLRWPSPEELRRELEGAGLEETGYRLLTGGIACLHYGRVPGP